LPRPLLLLLPGGANQFPGGTYTAVDQRLSRRTEKCGLEGYLSYDGGDQLIGLLDGAARRIDESCLDVAPARAEIVDFEVGEDLELLSGTSAMRSCAGFFMGIVSPI
jgi:hypothetical protein